MASRLIALRTVNWRGWLRFRKLFVSGALLGALAIGGLLAMRALRPAVPVQVLPGQTLAWDIARAVGRSEGVRLSSGSYLPGDRLLLYTRTDQTDRMRVRSWALLQLEPFADRLAKMPGSEKLTWMIDFGPPPGEQETISAPLSKAADPSTYTYVSGAPGLIAETGETASIAPATAQPTAAPAAAQPTIAPAAAQPPAASSNPTIQTQVGEPVVANNFDDTNTINSAWLPLSGNWVAHDGIYSQLDNSGFDYMSFLNLAPQAHYSIETKLRLGEGDMGGGFVYNAPSQTTRAGAQNIDFDNKGGFLRWGHYDDQGVYTYEGGVKVDPAINDGEWHTLRLVTHGDTSVVSLDGQEFGPIANISTSGYLGLLASKTKVDFDDVSVTILPENGAVVPKPTIAAPKPTTSPPLDNFTDDFADGDAKGWQVLSGTWQVIDNTYQQTNPTGSDLGSTSPFQSDSFSATVRLKRLDGDMGGGLYFNMAQSDKKSRSQMISYTQAGTAVQWGHFDEGGNFVFEGSAPTPDGGDGEWHTLVVQIKDGKATFTLDDKQLAKDVNLTYTSGYVGLLASNSKVAFDDVQFIRR
jgi:hypothetical protein